MECGKVQLQLLALGRQPSELHIYLTSFSLGPNFVLIAADCAQHSHDGLYDIGGRFKTCVAAVRSTRPSYLICHKSEFSDAARTNSTANNLSPVRRCRTNSTANTLSPARRCRTNSTVNTLSPARRCRTNSTANKLSPARRCRPNNHTELWAMASTNIPTAEELRCPPSLLNDMGACCALSLLQQRYPEIKFLTFIHF
jgi:hypothetical protein